MAATKQTILISGCTTGSAGHALALEFAAQGLRVFATARSLKSLAGLEEKGIETLTLDVTSAESIAALKAEITTRTGGKLDMLFNNAGIMYEAPAIEANQSRVRQMYDTNVFGLMDMVAAFTPLLLAAVSDSSRPPVIINTASILAVVPYPFSAAYNASKAAVASYSDTLRVELEPLGIKVVTLYMGVVSTGLFSPSSIEFQPNGLFVEAEAGVRKRGEDHIKTGAKPAEFAKQVVATVLKQKRGPGKGEYVWKGAMATIIWFLSVVGGRKVFDSTNAKEIGWNDQVKRAIAERGRKSVQNVSAK
ncbi:NAD(P)-binding protein [Plenodomus tracheiphilus IPT5]|uniref:NAD(P)-binding protein n=1 Tax=Plenodomus tracheiphilus IPT5 TaxID=1408161 RepID=A0A6A7B6D9_9PLEO|nr:NAD(P)-binding protein [Plenodomus tracheiphilus IPT5]